MGGGYGEGHGDQRSSFPVVALEYNIFQMSSLPARSTRAYKRHVIGVRLILTFEVEDGYEESARKRDDAFRELRAPNAAESPTSSL